MTILERLPAHLRYRFSALLVIGVFNLLIFNRYFPLSEGWWETYGYLYNLGLKPYRDFNLAFTPLFTIINGYLLDIFGSSFFNLRLFGVAVYLLAIFFLQLFLEQFYSAKTSAIAVIVASFLVFSEPQFIAKDYHTYQLLLVSLALLLHTWMAGNASLTKLQNLGGTLLLGLMVCLIIFLKQNVGVLLYVAFMASFLLLRGEWLIPRLLALGMGAAIAIFVMLPIVSFADWQNVLFANDAKGDLVTVLGRALIDPANRRIIKISAIIATAYFFVHYLINSKVNGKMEWWHSVHSILEQPLAQRALMASTALLVVGVAITNTTYGLLRELLIPVTLALLIVLSYKIYQRVRYNLSFEVNAKCVAIVLPLLALAYSNTNTASFDFNGMQIPVAFAVGWILSRIEVLPNQKFWLLGSLIFLAIVPRIIVGKLMVPYSWWENVQGSVFSAKYQTNYQDMTGIYVNDKYRDVFNVVKQAVDDYSLTNSDVYFYNLPIFYSLHKKTPPFRVVVHWFDVVSSRQMENELLALEKQPPRVIVALEPPPTAFAANRQLKHSAHLPQEDFLNQLDQWVYKKKYRLVRSIALPTRVLRGLGIEGQEITQDISVQNSIFLGKDVQRISNELGLAQKQTKMLGVIRNGLAYPIIAGFTLEAGDALRLQGDYREVMVLSEKIGVARESPRDWNSVNIYLRDDVL